MARDATSLTIGASSIRCERDALVLDVDEIAAPWPKRIKGRIRVTPEHVYATDYLLEGSQKHRWRPIAPFGRIEVALDHPSLSWRGTCYVDRNNGDEPLENAFQSWSWSRAHLREGAAVLYEALGRDGATTSMALRFDQGRCDSFEPPPRAALPNTLWGVARETRADAGDASVAMKFEDGPFYSRSLLRTRLLGEDAFAVHESLSLDRFRAPWVQMLLPFRMPRRG
jgi:carotenoid 1,2-hydratase